MSGDVVRRRTIDQLQAERDLYARFLVLWESRVGSMPHVDRSAMDELRAVVADLDSDIAQRRARLERLHARRGLEQ